MIANNSGILVAALVSNINPKVGAGVSGELQVVQRRLLGALFQVGVLDHHPLAMANLAQLMETGGTGAESSTILYKKAIELAPHLVFPRQMLANYYAMKGQHSLAIQAAADATQVMGKYHRCSDSKELWIETDEQQRNLPRVLAKALEEKGDRTGAFELMRFYDGLCHWEACPEAKTTVFSSDWSRHLFSSVKTLQDNDVRMEVAESFTSDNPKMQSLLDILTRPKLNKSAVEMCIEAIPSSSSSTNSKKRSFEQTADTASSVIKKQKI